MVSISSIRATESLEEDHPSRFRRGGNLHDRALGSRHKNATAHRSMSHFFLASDFRGILVRHYKPAINRVSLRLCHRVVTLVFELFLFVLTLVKCTQNCVTLLRTSETSPKRSLYYIFLRDGTWAFALISGMLGAWVKKRCAHGFHSRRNSFEYTTLSI